MAYTVLFFSNFDFLRFPTDKTEIETTIIIPYMANRANTSSSFANNPDENVKKTTGAGESEINRYNITVTYSMWVGSNISEKYSLTITVDHNVTFYEIMEKAAAMDSKYS